MHESQQLLSPKAAPSPSSHPSSLLPGHLLSGSSGRYVASAALLILLASLASSAFFASLLNTDSCLQAAQVEEIQELAGAFREHGHVLLEMRELASNMAVFFNTTKQKPGAKALFNSTRHALLQLSADVQQLAAAAKAAHSAALKLQETLLEKPWGPLPAKPSGLRGCILYSDSRTLWEGSDYVDKGYDYFEVNGRRLPSFIAAKFINRAYARRHGYDFIDTGDETFPTDRHPSWFKILHIRRHLSCCCKWAFFLDSDAYFRMDNHRLSVEDWVRSLEAKDHFDYIQQHFDVSMVNQTWLPSSPLRFLDPEEDLSEEALADFSSATHPPVVAIVPRSGAHPYGYWGRPSNVFQPKVGYMNAGVMLWRRSKLALKVLDEWYDIPGNDGMRFSHPWEQSKFNRVGIKYKRSFLLVPYFELTGPNGFYVRHIWSDHHTNRTELLQSAVLGTILAQEVTKYAGCL